MWNAAFRRTCTLLLMCVVIADSPTWALPHLPRHSPTLTEQISAAQVVVIGKLVERSPKADTAKFEIVQVLKGAEHVKNLRHIDATYTGRHPDGTRFLLIKGNPPNNQWRTPC